VTDRITIRDGEADTAVIAEYEATRRDAVRRGIVVGGAVLAATSIPGLLRVRNAFAQAEGDAGILQSAIGVELTAVVAYDAMAKSGLLDPRIEKVTQLFRDQEQEHADGLITALKELEGEAPPKPRPEDIEGLGDIKSQTDILNFAVELENMAVAAYYDAHGRLEGSRLLQTAAQIMANEGQHLVVLRQALRKNPVPDAFERGRAP
jgi:rubrerythrin